MEFALTEPAALPALMTPGSRAAPGVFCCAPRQLPDWSQIAPDTNRCIWCPGNACPLRSAGRRANSLWQRVPLWHFGHKSDGLLPSGPDRTIHSEPPGDLSRLARGHRRGLLWRIHDLFELRLGDGQDAGRWRVAARDHIRRHERRGRLASLGSGHSAGEPILGATMTHEKFEGER